MKKLLFIVLFSIVLLFSCSQKSEIQPAIVEFENADTTFAANLINYCKFEGYEPQIYQWKNRVLYFAEKPSQANVIANAVKYAFPDIKYKIYENPFYVFNRDRCINTQKVEKCDYFIISANLVENEKMQQEYMDYHATQFENFPEVSEGFCKADFQYLNVYRQGRQLMLVIAYPHFADFNELNSRTVENNPRVDEWNSIMGKYQEGIDGTDEGEVWVEFKKLRTKSEEL
jgi:Domain of unknown function (DUF718).